MPRDPYPDPQHEDKGEGITTLPNNIAFRHPGYADPASQILFLLPACDDNTVDYDVAKTACAIVACNRFDGFLTRDIKGHDIITDTRLPLRAEGYYFHVGGSESGCGNCDQPCR